MTIWVFTILLYLHLIWSESLISREGLHGISHEGCFICKVQDLDVKRGNRGVMFVNQRPTALQNTHRREHKVKTTTHYMHFKIATQETFQYSGDILGSQWHGIAPRGGALPCENVCISVVSLRGANQVFLFDVDCLGGNMTILSRQYLLGYIHFRWYLLEVN